MKALVFDEVLTLKSDFPRPKPASEEALVKVLLAGICNTDKEIMNGYVPFKGVLGHEFVGVVEECVEKDYMGKRVVGDINIGCGDCEFCHKGLPNHCLKRETLGIHIKDGVFAEYLTIPIKNLHIVPESVSSETAVFSEPLAAAFNILENNVILPESKVAIIGDGKLGLLISHAISTRTPNLFLIGKHPEKMALVEDIVNPILLSDVKDLNDRFDFVIECTGNESGFEMAVNIVKSKGIVVLKSTYSGTVEINPSLWVQKEIRIIGSRCGHYEQPLSYLHDNRIDLTKFIEKRYFIEDWEEAFKAAFKKGALKVLLDFNQK